MGPRRRPRSRPGAARRRALPGRASSPQQAPLAVEQVKLVSNKGDLDEGIEAEKQGFAKVFLSEDGREGISAFLQKRKAQWKGK